MAKGQKRSTREAKKPKQDKTPVKQDSQFANVNRLTANLNAPNTKGKS